MMRRWLMTIPALLLVSLPSAVYACAVCFGGEDDNRQAFIDTTVVLTVAPLIIIGLFIWLMVRRIAKVEKLRQEQLEADRLARSVSANPSGAEVS